jgi:hypothetical protein
MACKKQASHLVKQIASNAKNNNQQKGMPLTIFLRKRSR